MLMLDFYKLVMFDDDRPLAKKMSYFLNINRFHGPFLSDTVLFI